MSSLVVHFSRVTLAGALGARSPANRFLSHVQLNGAAQVRSLAVSSGGFPTWSGQRPRIDDGNRLDYSVALQQQRQLCQRQSLRYFYRDATTQRAQPAQQIPDKKREPQTDDCSKASPFDGGGGGGSGRSMPQEPPTKQGAQQPDDSFKPPSPVDAGGSSSSSMQQEEPLKLGLFARFKKMYKEYWYVLVPVHCVTSVFWLGGFYYASKSGVDVIALLESMGVSQKLIDPVRDSSLGHIAVAYLLYKIATPARYTVTLGGTTLSIKYLVQWGYIKPMPSKAKLVQMYKDKKQDFHDRKQQLTDASKKNLQDTVKTLKPKKEDVTEHK